MRDLRVTCKISRSDNMEVSLEGGYLAIFAGGPGRSTYMTPAQARRLAEWLNEAADKLEPPAAPVVPTTPEVI
jgi:hypothetical protein